MYMGTRQLGMAAQQHLGIDLGHDERHALFVPEGGRVVDDHRAVIALGDLLGPLEREVATHLGI